MDIGSVRVLISESDLNKWLLKALANATTLNGIPSWISLVVESFSVKQQENAFCISGSVNVFSTLTPVSTTIRPVAFGSDRPFTIGFRVDRLTIFEQGNRETTLLASKFVSHFAQGQLSKMDVECLEGVLWVNLLHVFLRMGITLSGHILDVEMTSNGLCVEIGE